MSNDPTGYKATQKAGKWEDISELFSPKFIEELKAGKKEWELSENTTVKLGAVLKFRQPLSTLMTNIKVMRLDQKTGKIWGKRVDLVDGETAEQIMQDQMNAVGTTNRAQRRWVAKKKR